MTLDELAWNEAGLIPAVVQETETGEVLTLAWMNREALEATLATRRGTYWSRSRNELWRKGDTSGNAQHVDGLYADCDRDALLVQVHQEGVACHTGARSCFFTRVPSPHGESAHVGATAEAKSDTTGSPGPGLLEIVERTIQARKAERPAGSYVVSLLDAGEARISRKIGEEAMEVVTAALGGEGDERLVAEMADLWFHGMVLLGARGIPLRRLFAELARRHAGSPR